MAIQRVEALTFGVEDVEAGIRYFDDWGLEAVERGTSGATYRTQENQFIKVRPADDPSLPSSPAEGSTLREAVWGVDSADGLAAIAKELSTDREVTEDSDGTLHSRDDTGFGIAFAVANRTVAKTEGPGVNLNDSIKRVNEPMALERQARPIRIGHIVYTVPTTGWQDASAFYLERLGFRLTDRSMNLGDFMRVPGEGDHHTLGLFHFGERVGFGHVAFEVHDFDEIMLGGRFMKNRGWEPANSPGRRIVGSNLYWNFKSPCGGATEYFADIDHMDDSWEARIFEKHPGGDIWSLESA